MTNDEEMRLSALECLLNLTHEDDWHLIHQTINQDVRSGVVSVEFEKAYATLVDKMIGERGL